MIRLRFYGSLALLVTVLKLAVWWIDATPLLFLGDSVTYLEAAAHGYLPICRSFTYPWLLDVLALPPGSLPLLVLAQTAAGAATAWLLGAALFRYGRVPPAVAMAAAALLAIDPLLLVHERLVLTESFALLGYALTLCLGLEYLRRPRLIILLATTVTGLMVCSLRHVFIPVMLLFPTLVVLLAVIPALRSSGSHRVGRLLVHLAAAWLATTVLHASYRSYVGRHFGGVPGYQHMDGLMVLAAWAPRVNEADATDPRVAAAIGRQRKDTVLPLSDRRLREEQIWHAGGLVDRIVQDGFGGRTVAANAAAHATALRVLRRDPFGVLHLAAATWIEALRRPDILALRVQIEQGCESPLPPEALAFLRERVGYDAAANHTALTPARSYHRFAWPWYIVLALSPLLNVATVLRVPREQRFPALLIAACAVLLMATTVLTAPTAVVRYLHPFSFTALLALAWIAAPGGATGRSMGGIGNQVAEPGHGAARTG